MSDPIAIVGMACRLPGENFSPSQFWEFLKRGGIASSEVPESRFSIDTHYNGITKPHMMRTPGGKFLEKVDLRDFDAGFFNISPAEVKGMDPQQRLLLEVVYESLENCGIPLDAVDGAQMGCFVGSFLSDYDYMQARDPDNRPSFITTGIGRAILSNRISHFLNLKGPSLTVDTGCSGSLVGVDLACRYLSAGDIDSAIVAACNLFFSPEHTTDQSSTGAIYSGTGQCHTFDGKADGYAKAEGVGSIVLKRLSDAIRDRDPIRAVIRGWAVNSDGQTAGISTPDADAQAACIRSAYAKAGINDLSATPYVEFHGTGTKARDLTEVQGIDLAFSPAKTRDQPLIIGSVKSNIGHAEAVAGLNGLLKAALTLENGTIPANPTFDEPSPLIDFKNANMRALKAAIPWPENAIRRASVNSFGYGGTNCHVVLDGAGSWTAQSGLSHVSSYSTTTRGFLDDFDDDENADTASKRPFLLVQSASDEVSLKKNCTALANHFSKINVKADIRDLAYTLSERRSHHLHRAFIVTDRVDMSENDFEHGKKDVQQSRICFVFTGQGSQWPQMGKDVLQTFPVAAETIKELDEVLRNLPQAPSWKLWDELTEPRDGGHIRQPELSQPLVTALQLAIVDLFRSCGIDPQGVVGHSSGEIAAAYAAGYVTKADAIKIAFYRGYAAKVNPMDSVGMMAVGLGPDAVIPYIEAQQGLVQIACVNSPQSVTLSGRTDALAALKGPLTDDGHFARLLQVDLAYHSRFMSEIGQAYHTLLKSNTSAGNLGSESTTMFSSVTGSKMEAVPDAHYWKQNMVSPVLFSGAVQEMLNAHQGPNLLIEIGPSATLGGPIKQIKEALAQAGTTATAQYAPVLSRKEGLLPLFRTVGNLYIAGAPIQLAPFNRTKEDEESSPSVIVDLPNYSWNHTTKYWYETRASRDWRFRRFEHHDLLGLKILGTSWQAASWSKTLNIREHPWLKDHKVGPDAVFPAAGYLSMAMEALYQVKVATGEIEEVERNQLTYQLRNIKLKKALVLDENIPAEIQLTIESHVVEDSRWYRFKVASLKDDISDTNCSGLIRIDPVAQAVSPPDLTSPAAPTQGAMWYSSMANVGQNYGPAFQQIQSVRSLPGVRRTVAEMRVKDSEDHAQSPYPLHPIHFDTIFQCILTSLWQGDRTLLTAPCVPVEFDSLTIYPSASSSATGTCVATSNYKGRGRLDDPHSYSSIANLYDSRTGGLLASVNGMICQLLSSFAPERNEALPVLPVWRPDVSLLRNENLGVTEPLREVQQLINLVLHKIPRPNVLEVNLTEDASSLWLEGGDLKQRQKFQDYRFLLANSESAAQARENLSEKQGVRVGFIDPNDPQLVGLPTEIDLLIINYSSKTMTSTLQSLLPVAQQLLPSGRFVLPVNQGATSTTNGVISGHKDASKFISETLKSASAIQIMTAEGNNAGLGALWRTADSAPKPQEKRTIAIARFRGDSLPFGPLSEALSRSSYEVKEHFYPFATIPEGAIVLVVDEIQFSLMANPSEKAWDGLKSLINKQRRILWVTKGSQYMVSNPDNNVIHGVFRTVRLEDPSHVLLTLDVEGEVDSPSTCASIVDVLPRVENYERGPVVDHEFVERGGLVHVSRVEAQEPFGDLEGPPTQLQQTITQMHSCESIVQLRTGTVGSVDSLRWVQTTPANPELADDKVEVELYAVGLNFKDVAIAMGLVHENEHLLGNDGAGIVRRTGRNVTNLRAGDRVAVLTQGAIANRIHAPAGQVIRIPDTMSLEEAATVPVVYCTAVHAIVNLANLKQSQTVLIHSATGGFGLACVEIAKHIGAEIYATAGTEGKRNFLHETYGIPKSHLFSSRDASFAQGIMSATNGKGIDAIINTLTGDLLDQSWKICARGGTMVELGKTDIRAGGYLSLEPFDRNCSFRAFDLTILLATPSLMQRYVTCLLSQCFRLIEAGHVRPIQQRTIYPYEKVKEAFGYLRSARHLGKVVLTNGEHQDFSVPVQPAAARPSIRSDASYLIVGGLRGVCGRFAVSLARWGAKNIIVMSRSGANDDRAKTIIETCRHMGCDVQQTAGSITSIADVRRAFDVARFPVAGVIQGVMVLNDKPYENMTVSDFMVTMSGKVQGTWNLHNAAIERALPLDFFTVVSSVLSVLGNGGQANYCAANLFLDGFAHYRQAHGLPASSINLSAVEDIGYIAENQGSWQRHLPMDDIYLVREKHLDSILRHSLLQQMDPSQRGMTPQVIVGIKDQLSPGSQYARYGRFASLIVDADGADRADTQAGSSGELANFIDLATSEADATKVVSHAVELFNKQLTKFLHLEEPMEPAKPLTAYGLDSLTALEFRNWLRDNLGVEMTTLDIASSGSLYSLSEKFVFKFQEASKK
ncbi:ketoacyl-synt-domain-containing protein [Aspergillus ellipticus CBS 707.79]|uniref:Ketoacyl-synt-domain-containing protein n=1 Tax=Aspergillus ellipticus CBS 707.79 TaxID=1448320 RepID=A0A319DZX7_9EURO|nr:ketoacyl-synt-domain-containing protein [Aspergillus ellipticus CBS 707.79]